MVGMFAGIILQQTSLKKKNFNSTLKAPFALWSILNIVVKSATMWMLCGNQADAALKNPLLILNSGSSQLSATACQTLLHLIHAQFPCYCKFTIMLARKLPHFSINRLFEYTKSCSHYSDKHSATVMLICFGGCNVFHTWLSNN